MIRAENGDVKRTFDVYGDFDGVQCGRRTQFMSRSLCREQHRGEAVLLSEP